MEDHPDVPSMLEGVPASLWAFGPYDVGLCTVCPPVQFQVQEDVLISQPQYRNKPEAEEGLIPAIHSLVQAGVLIPSVSTWNTLILPVPKPGRSEYRMAHDLRRINDITTTPCVSVPNPHCAIQQLQPTHQWFTVIDLANAFFCLPLHSDLQHLFAFTFKGQKYQYTLLPQGFKLSPGLFNQVLQNCLSALSLPADTILIQYVDDLLIASSTASSCLSATRDTLLKLHDSGFKVAKKKLQCVRRTVHFLGRIVSSTGVTLSTAHRQAILHHPKPITVRDMLVVSWIFSPSCTFLYGSYSPFACTS